MFIQVIQGRTSRQQEVRDLLDEWARELGNDGHGWLGGTYGVTAAGDFLAVVRFESRELAMENSDRPETGAYADRLAELLDGPMDFQDCDDVTVFLAGGSDDAGFVQVIRGRSDDPDRLKSTLSQSTDTLQEARPEIIGGTLAFSSDGRFTETVAFTDEESARRGEQQEPPAELRDALDEMIRGAEFYDLRQPWFL